MLSGITDSGRIITGITQSDIMGKLEYLNNLQHFLSGLTEDELIEPNNKYSLYDFCYGAERADEIKYRDIYASKYINEGYMLEWGKYNELSKFGRGIYICFFVKSRICLVWDIADGDRDWVDMKCATNCQFGKYSNKRNKRVCKLSYDNATAVLFKGSDGKYRGLNKVEKDRCKEWLKKEKDKLLES